MSGKRLTRLPCLLTLLWTSGILFGTVTAQDQRIVHDDLFSITFPNERDGWACGRWGTILHTRDGGLTWTRQESGADTTLVAVHFPDPQNGWAVGAQGTILRTADGGVSWTRQECPVDSLLMDVCFAGALKGWIVTERTRILATDNGGDSWRVQFNDQDFILRAVSFGDALHGWAVGEYGYIYRTADGGEHWEAQAGYYDVDEDGNLVGDPSLFDVTALDGMRAWAVGLDGHVIFTEDGGRTWRKAETGAPPVPLYCVTSNRAGTLVIGGKGICLTSGDAGRNWTQTRLDPPITYTWIYALAARGPSAFAAVGERGIVYLGEGGGSWKRVDYRLK